MFDTRAFVIHSDTGCPIVECPSVNEARRVVDFLTATRFERFHFQLAADMVREPAVGERVVA